MARRVQIAEGAMTVEWPSLSRDQHGYEEFMSGMTINLIIQLFVGAIGDNVVGATFARFLRADHVTYPMLPWGRVIPVRRKQNGSS
jgi:hypothetical protein